MLTYAKCLELKENGFPQEGSKNGYTEFKDYYKHVVLEQIDEPIKKTIACPSFEEIWDLLPNIINSEEKHKIYHIYHKSLIRNNIGYANPMNEVYYKNSKPIMIEGKENKNITEIAADLWLLLKKNELIQC